MPTDPPAAPDAAHAAAEPQPWWRAVAVDIRPLRRHREFRLLWSGQAVTFLGTMVTLVAVPYQVYAMTRSSVAVGLLGLVEFVVIVLTAFVGGALADAVDRRRMVRVTEAGLMAVVGSLGINALVPHPRLDVLYVAVGLAACLDALQRPSLDALLPRLVPVDDLTAAGSLSMLRSTVAMIAGPALGGLLIATVGLPWTYGVDVLTFAVSLALLQRMSAVPPPPEAGRPSLRSVGEGVRYARSRPELVGTYLVDMNAMFFGMPNALFPALAAGFGGPSALGLLYAAPAVGSFLATLTSGWATRVHRHGLAVLWAAGLWGLAILGVGLCTRLEPALVLLALAGAADMISGIFRSVIWNTTIPDALRGRLAGIELIGYSSGPTLGNLEAGAVAGLAGSRFSLGFGGLMSVAGTLVLAAALPGFRRYDSRSATRAEARAG